MPTQPRGPQGLTRSVPTSLPLSHWPFMMRCLILLAVLTLPCRLALAAPPTSVDFNADVLPILEQHCLDCHGSDFAESNLALHSPSAALTGGDSGEPSIVPGNPAASYLLSRITDADPSQRMPPDADPLDAADVEVLRRWIADKSNWVDVVAAGDEAALTHWSFQPLSRPALPTQTSDPTTTTTQNVSPIDAFVRAKLIPAGLQPSPRADRRRLIRRLYLVMHGLPPTPAQLEAFIADERPEAWEMLVEEVLASPRYGERWATYWLDLVRFGETHGFETNRERPNAWRYRDWVIQALNQDMPYDEFVVAQIAGDAVEQPLGTGFLVAGPYDIVKGQDELLRKVQRQDELTDILNTTGTAFLGLTLGCARCHNHKFDPITQTDFYAMQAAFAGVQHAERPLPPDPDAQQQIAENDRRISELESALSPYLAPPRRAVVVTADGTTQRPEQLRPEQLRPAVKATGNDEWIEPTPAKYLRFTILKTNGGEPCIDELEAWAGDRNVALASLGTRATSSGDFQHRLHQLKHINDGQYGNPRSWISAQTEGGWVQLEFAQPERIERIRWARDREGNFADRTAVNYRIELSADGTHWKTVATADDRQTFGSPAWQAPPYDFTSLDEAQKQHAQNQLDELQQLRRRQTELRAPVTAYVGTFRQPGPTHRLYRGEPASPREPVAPAGISALCDVRLPDDSPEQTRRLEIAHWIASPDNPLTARVIVNRLWQHHFGTGIVSTPSDFGRNGTPPSHPQLLDWLATELIDSGWSLKHIHRQLLLSEIWQQDSRPHPEGLHVDAQSRLIWRFPPRRLSAEAIRDSMLAVTAKLDLQTGGPGYSPFQVELENVRHYHPKTSFGPEDWRRMIYMTRVRQEREATFGLFDCPDFSQVVPKRSRSTTPLQALNLLNSPFVLQQADFLAERVIQSHSSDPERVQQAYRWVYGRPAETDEVRSALQFIEQTDWASFARALLNSNEFVLIP